MKNLFASRLTEAIKESGKTQNLIAKELNISKQQLSNWKLGRIEPNIDDIIMLATYFNVSTDFLLGKTEV